MKYQVEIEEILKRVVTVETGSSREAIGIVARRYRDCEIVLGAEDFKESTIRIFENEE